MKKLILLFVTALALSAKSCYIPNSLYNLIKTNGAKNLLYIKDVKRNYNDLKNLCVSLISFKEAIYKWKLLLVLNPKKRGPFWFLPHDNENSAFDSALFATKKYGGGFLAIVNNDKRYNLNQDPNRNFSYSKNKICPKQYYASPKYTKIVFDIINFYKRDYPYLSLHNNVNKGSISILKSSNKEKSFLAYKKSDILKGIGLADEDNLVYIAGDSKNYPINKIKKLLNVGLNVKYEIVNFTNNDCSMSNFIVLELNSNNYYNIEAQHGKTKIQKVMIDRLLKTLR